MHKKLKIHIQSVAGIGQAKYVDDTVETENGDGCCNVVPEPVFTLFTVLMT